MKPKISISLEFLHLENAIFCAEQSVSAGIDTLEIGATLLKNTGLTSIKVLKERFPKIALIADMKIQNNVEFEIKAIADAGASGVTISGSVSRNIWLKSIEIAKKYNVEAILDFREIIHAEDYMVDIPEDFNMVMLSPVYREGTMFTAIQKVLSSSAIPIGIKGVHDDDSIMEAISIGVSTICIGFSDTKEQNIQEVVKNTIKILSDVKKTFPKDPVALHEQQLCQILDQISPNEICELNESPCFLANIYPLQKYTKIVGKAVTIKVLPGSSIVVLDFLLQMPPDYILVIDAGGSGSAVWGQIETEVAIKQQIKGVVVYGGIKDVNKIREKGLPCYFSNITPVSHKKQSNIIEEIPVKIGEVTISKGDWLIGDDTGIISIPKEDVFSKAKKAFDIYNKRMQIIREVETSKDQDISEIVAKYKNLYFE